MESYSQGSRAARSVNSLWLGRGGRVGSGASRPRYAECVARLFLCGISRNAIMSGTLPHEIIHFGEH